MSSYLFSQSLVYPEQFNDSGTSAHNDGYSDRYPYSGADAWVANGASGDVGASSAPSLEFCADAQRSPHANDQGHRETLGPQDYRLPSQHDFPAYSLAMIRNNPATAHLSGNSRTYGVNANNVTNHIHHQGHQQHHHEDHRNKRHNRQSGQSRHEDIQPYQRPHQVREIEQSQQRLEIPKQEPISSGPTSPLLLHHPRQSTPVNNEATSPTTSNAQCNSSSSSRASEFPQSSPMSPMAFDARSESPGELLSGNESGNNNNNHLSPVHNGSSGIAIGTIGKQASGKGETVHDDVSPPRTHIYPWMRRNHVGTGK